MINLYIVTNASYTEDGELSSSAIAYTDLEVAKKSLREDYEKSNLQYGEDDRKSWISPDGMSWGTSRDAITQEDGKIVVQQLLHVKKIFE